MTHKTADVAVIGAGIMGLSIAYQLARRGAGDVVVVEKAAGPAEGSTGASSAVVRQRYTHEEVVVLARDAKIAYRDWAEFTQLAAPRARLTQIGVLWLTGESAEDVASDLVRLQKLDVPIAALKAADLKERFPSLSACGVPFHAMVDEDHECVDHDDFLLEEDGGHGDPVAATQDLLDAARREGTEVLFKGEVAAVRTAGGRIQGLDLADGTIVDAPVVVNAAGPWCNQIHQMAGLEMDWPLIPTRVQVTYRSRPDEVALPLPVVGDIPGGIYFRPESAGQQILVGSVREEDEREAVDDPDDFKQADDRGFRDRMIYSLHHRIPSLPYRGDVTGLAGLYTVNLEDVHPIVGRTEVDGYVVANGFSGHGFKLGPMIGSMVAQEITGERADFDTDVPVSFFGVDRDPIVMAERNVLA